MDSRFERLIAQWVYRILLTPHFLERLRLILKTVINGDHTNMAISLNSLADKLLNSLWSS